MLSDPGSLSLLKLILRVCELAHIFFLSLLSFFLPVTCNFYGTSPKNQRPKLQTQNLEEMETLNVDNIIQQWNMYKWNPFLLHILSH